MGVSNLSTTELNRFATALAMRAARRGAVSRTVMSMSTVLSGTPAVIRDASSSGVVRSPNCFTTGAVT